MKRTTSRAINPSQCDSNLFHWPVRVEGQLQEAGCVSVGHDLLMRKPSGLIATTSVASPHAGLQQLQVSDFHLCVTLTTELSLPPV